MSIRGRLVASHFILTLVVVLVIGLLTLGRVRAFILDSAESTLVRQAEQIGMVIDRRSLLPQLDRTTGTAADRLQYFGGAALARLISQLTAADFMLLDPEGLVIVGSERFVRYAGTLFQTDLVARVLAVGQPASATVRDPLGRLSVVAVAPIPGASGPEGAVALVRPVVEVTQATRRYALLIVESLLLGLALSLLASLLLARGLTRPLVALEGAAAKIASGDFNHRVPVEYDDELGRVTASFNAMAERLGALQRERQELYASVSHELRTPVTSIKGFAQALEDNVGSPEEQRRHVAIILEETSRLERLVADLFQLARLETGQVAFEWQDLDLAALAAGVVEKHRPAAQAAGITLRYAGPGPVIVRGDRDRLTQVLANLIENALRFTPTGGRVTATVAAQSPAALVTVADTGPGIPEEDRDRVFDRFYTVDRSRARAKGGTGLGLAIVREIVLAHGGRVWADRAPEGGALLSFTIPLSRSGNPEPSRPGTWGGNPT